VEVAFEPPSFGVGSFDYPDQRRAKVGNPGAQFGFEPLVLQGQGRGGTDRIDQLSLPARAGSQTKTAIRRSLLSTTLR